MSAPSPNIAWLERLGQERVPMQGVCNLGRSASNQVILQDRKASRRHALIQPQGAGEYWLVDFGSTNGTVVNGRRVVQPTLLNDGDQISIGDECLVFRKIVPPAEAPDINEGGTVTLEEIKSIHCWLLLVDIEGSSELSHSAPPDELPVILGRWFSDCKETVESCGGQINKYLGDGFLAYWPEEPSAAENVKRAVAMLCQAQDLSQPQFRWILHYGQVSVGGAMSMGEASLLGRDVNFAFRMEKLAGQAAVGRMLSLAAHEKLSLGQPCREIGPFEINGFPGSYMFRTF
jgi:adenylate cyclase